MEPEEKHNDLKPNRHFSGHTSDLKREKNLQVINIRVPRMKMSVWTLMISVWGPLYILCPCLKLMTALERWRRQTEAVGELCISQWGLLGEVWHLRATSGTRFVSCIPNYKLSILSLEFHH